MTISGSEHPDAGDHIGRMIELARAELAAARGTSEGTESAQSAGGWAAKGGTAQDRRLEDLERAIARLQTMQQWMADNPELLRLVDQYIGQRVAEARAGAARRGLWTAMLTTVAGALLGWLLSLVGPPVPLLHVLHP